MKVQACASCGARYNVERLAGGSRFECRRCQAPVEVGSVEAPACRFSPGLLVASTLLLAALFLYANPADGSEGEGWPWEIVQRDGPWMVKATIVLQALAGVWALVTSLGIAPRSRSVLTVALAGVLAMACCSGGGAGALALDAWVRPLPILLAVSTLGAGLLVLRRPRAETLARALTFAGGIALVWHYAFGFADATPALQSMVEQVRAWFAGDLDGTVSVWQELLPAWALVLAGLVGVVAGFGAGGRVLAWSGLALLIVAMILPASEILFEDGLGAIGGTKLADAGRAALTGSGLALWLLASYGLADLASNRKATA